MASVDDGTYIIHNAGSPGCALDCEGQQFRNGTNLIIWTSNHSDAQIWLVKTRRDGKRRIINRRCGKSMDVLAAQTSTTGQNIQLWDDNDTTAQQWSLVDTGETVSYNGTTYPTFYILLNSGYCAGSNGIAALSNVQVQSGSASTNKWFFEPVPLLQDGGVYEIRTALNKRMGLEVVGGIANGANIQLNYASDRNTMKFVLAEESGDKWSLYNPETGKYVDVAGGAAVHGTNVQQWDDNDSRAQRWNVVSYGTGTVNGVTCFACRLGSYVTNDGIAYKMDVSRSDSSVGNNVQIWDNNNNDAQLWYLLPTTAEDVTMPVPYNLGIAIDKSSRGSQWIETSSDGAYLYWECSKAWQADGNNHYELRWRYRYMRSTTSSWRSWSNWTAWTTPAVRKLGNQVWTADPLDADYSFSTDKNMEIEFQVRGVGTDEYSSLHSKVAGTTVRIYKRPTVAITGATYSPEGLRLAFTNDYVWGTTYVTLTKITNTTNGKVVLNKPVRLELQTATDSDLIKTADLVSLPEDGGSYRFEYRIGYDQNTLFPGYYPTSLAVTYDGGNYDFDIDLVESGMRLYAVVAGLASTRCWVTEGKRLYECPKTSDYVEAGKTVFDIPYPMSGSCTIYVSTHNAAETLYGTTSTTWSNTYIAHAFTTDDGHTVFLHKFVETAPSMNRTRGSVYEADVLDARAHESVSFNGTVKSTLKADGALLRPDDYSTIEEFQAIEGKHGVFRDLYGDMWQVAFTNVDYTRNKSYDRVTVSMIEESI